MRGLAVVMLLAATAAGGGEATDMTKNLHWLGHDTFRFDGPPVVYVDPYQLRDGLPAADVILITHDHFDHLSPADVAKIHKAGTVVVAPKEVAGKLSVPVTVIGLGESKTVAGITIKAVPAYNTNKTFHPKADGKVGFVFTLAGVTYYHAGDTDVIPEMKGLAPDVALLPVSGTYVMTADEAATAARQIKPKVAVPMHYGAIVGSDADAKKFAKLLEGSGIQVVIKTKE
ncbi:MAG TPA: MBL fold metallo-hydrolase [Thermoanaerobaculaceae bacterium]|nr:MBL fold metallo-hydrolase [Thermoanaerobaculaceae bacterium]